MTTLLVLGTGGPNSAAVISMASSLGHDVHCAVPAPLGPGGTTIAGVTGTFAVDFGSPEAERVIAAYATAHGVAGVLTVTEFLTPLAARVCAALGLPGNDPGLADAPRNKRVMAAQFARHGVTAPRTFVVDTPEHLISVAEQSLTYPVVVKPTANAGSAGVTIVDDPAMLRRAFASARDQNGVTTPLGIRLDQRVLVQEHIGGQEYSVESVTQNGISTHLCITRKVTTPGPYPIEIGHSLPTRLGPVIEHRIFAEATQALAALGITNSTSHLELILATDGSCMVIEAAARIGAGQISALVDLALGISLPRAAIDLALGRPADIAPQRAQHAVSRLFVAPAAGRLADVRNLPAEGNGVHLVRLTRQPGSMVTGPLSNRARVGHFVVHGTADDEVNRRADDLLAQVEVVVDQSEVAEAGHRRA